MNINMRMCVCMCMRSVTIEDIYTQISRSSLRILTSVCSWDKYGAFVNSLHSEVN